MQAVQEENSTQKYKGVVNLEVNTDLQSLRKLDTLNLPSVQLLFVLVSKCIYICGDCALEWDSLNTCKSGYHFQFHQIEGALQSIPL